jgi:hypothetical protein
MPPSATWVPTPVRVKILVLPDVGGHHPPQPPRAEQQAKSPVVDARVVRNHFKLASPGRKHRLDQHRGNTAQPEPAHRERGTVRDVGDRRLSARYHLVHESDHSPRH